MSGPAAVADWAKATLQAVDAAHPSAAPTDNTALVEALNEIIDQAHTDLDQEIVDSEHTGERPDLQDSETTIPVDLLERLRTALSQPPTPHHPDDIAVDRFAAAMKAKLASARAKGRHGWDDPEDCTDAFLATLLVNHVPKGNAGNFEDIANLAMMLHQRGADPDVLQNATPRQPCDVEALEAARAYFREWDPGAYAAELVSAALARGSVAEKGER